MDTQLLKALCNEVCIGHIDRAAEVAEKELKKYAATERFGRSGVIARIGQGCDKTVMIEAHIDEVGFVVTHVYPDGFIKVANVGGNDPRLLPATPVMIHGKEDICGVFASTPPHLSGENEVKKAEDTLVDTGLGKDAAELIRPGDFVTYDSRLTELSGGRLSGKSLDDRSGVYCLAELARRLSDKKLPCNLLLCLSEQEELGTRGARTAAFKFDCDECIAIDVSFGDAPDVPATDCGRLGGGAMIGLSPVLSRDITDRLTAIAAEKSIPHQFEVMGGTTGTDADVISVSRDGVPCGLVSIPLRNMHTPCEVIDTKDIDSVCDLLEGYILGGGAL